MRNFKKAVFAVLGFALCLILFAAIIVTPYFRGQYYNYEDAQVRDALAGSVDLLVSGASHGMCAVVPEMLDEELGVTSYNLSGPLVTMNGRKVLLHEELERNPVKTVFLELSFNTLTRSRAAEGTEGEIYMLARMSGPFRKLRFFFSAFEDGEYLSVCADTMDRGFHAWSELLRGEPTQVDAAGRGFLARDPVDLSMTSEEFAALHHSDAMYEDIYWTNKHALFDIIEECRDRGIEVVFITTPLADRKLASYDNLELSHQWYLFYAQEYGVPYLDFNLYRQRDELFPDDTCFYDDTHLSAEGAETFTRELAKVYRAMKAGEDVSDLFYSDYYELDEAMVQAYSTP